ncbi:MAG: hypoxanthine phosphoribosyltransferase [Eubacteriales bacterium]|nr:hypoxanthine phosphoribosyltransferase [Eubacteriales bacterium]MDD4390981.1 hypoxanthine phosphoribosyltransferase [Eubacteriales bacterium]
MEKVETVGQIMITEEEIRARAVEIGRRISEDFSGESLLFVGILKGAVMWMSDVIKNVDNKEMTIDFMVVSSYGASTKSSGVVKIVKDLDVDIEGKNVIIVEDIVDSGITLNYLKNYFAGRGAKTLKICTLLDKPEGRRVDLVPDYTGFIVEDKFIVGYGLDFDQKYRQLPYISFLK